MAPIDRKLGFTRMEFWIPIFVDEKVIKTLITNGIEEVCTRTGIREYELLPIKPVTKTETNYQCSMQVSIVLVTTMNRIQDKRLQVAGVSIKFITPEMEIAQDDQQMEAEDEDDFAAPIIKRARSNTTDSIDRLVQQLGS